jgi:hypothetical protein
MKTLSRTLKLVTGVAIGVTAIFVFQALAKDHPPTVSGAPYSRKYKEKKLKEANLDKFIQLLNDNGAIYCIDYRETANVTPEHRDNGGCNTMSKSAIDDARREMVLICGGAHVTQQAGFNSSADMLAVDAAFQ